MPTRLLCLLFSLLSCSTFAQQVEKLTVEKIMRDPKWIGTSPTNVQWSNDGQYLYFRWNPERAADDSLYYITLSNKIPVKASMQETQEYNSTGNYIHNQERTMYLYTKDGDVFITEVKNGRTRRITYTTDVETSPRFSFNESRVVYNRGQNLYAWDIVTGELIQLTNLRAGEASSTGASGSGRVSGGTGARSTSTNPQEEWLKNDQLEYFDVLKSRKEK